MESKVLEIIKKRYSVRKYSPKPVEEEKIKLILEAARLAPSSENSQPWHFFIVKDREKIEKIAKAMPLKTDLFINQFIAKAPVLIVACAANVPLIQRIIAPVIHLDWYKIDVAIALEHMVLTACELGLGTCWIGWFDEKKIKKILGMPKKHKVIELLTLGYPAEGFLPRTKMRKAMEEITTFVE
jgi:nitroreductase